YTYLWSNGQTTQTATGLAAGTYTVTVTDVNSCVATQTITITEPPVLTANTTSTPSCGGNSGTATVTAGGGTSPYTYLWSNGQTTSTATGLSAGSYTVTTTDANGCSTSSSITISPAPPVSFTLSSTQTSCTSNTGTATVNVTGGVSPFTYLWSNGQTTSMATALGVGNYTVTVTDSNGCSQAQTVNITSLGGPAATASVNSNVLCFGGSTGSASASATGGTSPYTYLWSNGQTSSSAVNLAAGSYSVTVTDANGCASSQTVTITQPNSLLLSTSTSADTCSLGNGTAGSVASGGTGPYSYLWSNGQTTPTITGLGSGTYTVTVTDANNCTQGQNVIVAAVGTVANAGSNVFIQQGGSITLTATGGGSYLWSDGSASSSITVSPASTTTYCVEVTNLNCSDSACVTVFVDVPCNGSVLSELMPNAFSPNRDGNNDLFCIPNNVCIIRFTLKVFDRWGEKIFETDNITDCWDGTYNGKDLNTAVFVYYFQAELSNGESYKQQGNISLIK
ncbi:MAG: gliding motility-associated C-terminal domain-containing protein, partial [Bacteroidota bacterium]